MDVDVVSEEVNGEDNGMEISLQISDSDEETSPVRMVLNKEQNLSNCDTRQSEEAVFEQNKNSTDNISQNHFNENSNLQSEATKNADNNELELSQEKLSQKSKTSTSSQEGNILSNRKGRKLIDSDSEDDFDFKKVHDKADDDAKGSVSNDKESDEIPVNTNLEDVEMSDNKEDESKVKKRIKFFDSDSDESVTENKDEFAKTDDNKKSDDSDINLDENEKQPPKKVKPHSRIQNLFDSDSSEEDKPAKEEKSSMKFAKKIDSDEEDDIFELKKTKKKRKNKKSEKRVKTFDLLNEDQGETHAKKDKAKHKSSVSDEDSDIDKNINKSSSKSSKIANLIDSESDDERVSTMKKFSDDEDGGLSGDETKGKKKKKENDRKSHARKSKDNAILEIKSETQRLMREAQISIPYHKPKQRTLEEFLNRKKSLNVVPSAPTIAAKLQMFSDIVSKVAEEKEKEAEIFFESSESETEKDDKEFDLESDQSKPLENVTESLNTNETPNTESQTVKPIESYIKSDETTEMVSTGLTENVSDLCTKENIAHTIDLTETNDLDNVDLQEKFEENPEDKILEAIEEENRLLLSKEQKDTEEKEKETGNEEEVKEKEAGNEEEVKGMEAENEEEKIMDNINWTEDDFFIIDCDKMNKKKQESDNKENEEIKTINIFEEKKEEKDDSQNITLKLDSCVDSTPKLDDKPEELAEESSNKLSKKALREKLLETVGNFVPKLSGSQNMMIDLSCDVKKVNSEGVNHLMERFAKQCIPKKKPKPVNEQKVDKEVIILNDENDDPKFKKPGVKMRMFKEILKQKIVSQRYEEWKKKEEEEKELDKKVKKIEGENDDANIEAILDLEEEEEIDDEEEEEEEDLVDDEYLFKEKKRKKSAFVDDEVEVSDDDGAEANEEDEEQDEDDDEDEDDEENDDNDEDEEIEENVKKTKKLKRIIRAFEDDEDENSNQSEPKTTNEEKNSSLRWKSVDTSADMFSNNSLTNESSGKEDYEPVFQQPRHLSEESSQSQEISPMNKESQIPDKSLKRLDTCDEKTFSPVFSNKSKSTENSLKNWLSKQTKLFDESPSKTVNEEELLDICSGKFDVEESQSLQKVSQNIDKIEENDKRNSLSDLVDPSQTQTESQLMEICSGEFVPEESSQKDEFTKPMFCDETSQDIKLSLEDDSVKDKEISPNNSIQNKLNQVEKLSKNSPSKKLEPTMTMQLSSDDEDDFTTKPKKKVLKKKAKPLVLSDDEDNENSDEFSIDEEESEIEQVDHEEEEKYIDYDSEENEVVVVPAKNIRKEAKKFLEHEAELSESDWDSADEDEKGLDRFEAEEADKEDIDENEVRDQLGKIHMKRVLDEDQRDVRLLKEILFEEGDLHSDGAGRERKFKWKNIDNIADNDEKGALNDYIDFGEDEDETELRKQRLERQKFLEKLKPTNDDDIQEDFNDSQIFQVGFKVATKTVKTVDSIKVTEEREIKQCLNTSVLSADKTTLMPSMLSSVLGITTNRTANTSILGKGSFLARGRAELTRIAAKLKPEKESLRGNQNFTFAHLSPSVKETEKDEDEEDSGSQNRKRKSAAGDTPTAIKKQKTSNGLSGKRLF